MNPDTINTIIQWLTLFTLIGAIVGSILIIGTAVFQSLKARTVRWDVLGFILVLLWSLPYGIRNYGPELMDASIDLINTMATKREPLEAAIKNLIGDTGSNDPTMSIGGGGTTIIGTMEPATPSGGFPTAVPQATPTINQFEATATVYFATAVPATLEPQPMIQPTATICIAWRAEQITQGCVPPTPQP